jgi:hypothetical protein
MSVASESGRLSSFNLPSPKARVLDTSNPDHEPLPKVTQDDIQFVDSILGALEHAAEVLAFVANRNLPNQATMSASSSPIFVTIQDQEPHTSQTNIHPNTHLPPLSSTTDS